MKSRKNTPYTKRNKELNVICQHCGKITKTRHVEDELICRNCSQRAKLKGQPTKLRKTYDVSNKTYVEYHVVLLGVLEKMLRKYNKLTESEKAIVNKSSKWTIQTSSKNQ